MKRKIAAFLAALTMVSLPTVLYAERKYEPEYLTNGDFENGIEGWNKTWQTGSGTLDVEKYEGSNVIHLKTANGRCYIGQDLQNITEGDRLTLSFKMKITELAEGAYACITFGYKDKAGQYIWQVGENYTDVNPDKWVYKGIDFIVPPGTGSMYLLMRVYNGGEVYYDDIEITDFNNSTYLTVTSQGMELDTLPEGVKEVTANLHYVPENTGESGNIIFAAYDGDELVSMKVTPFTANRSIYQKADLEIPEDVKDLSVKAYVWKNGSNSMPVKASVELPGEGKSEVFNAFAVDKMRGVYDAVALFYDTERQKKLEDMGVNTFIYNIIGDYNGDINTDMKALDKVCSDMEKYIDETGVHIFMKASYGASGGTNTAYGAFHPGETHQRNQPCPLSEDYWVNVMMNRLEVVAKHPKIEGVVFDMEMYSGGASSYGGPCMCDKCIDKYTSEHKGTFCQKLLSTNAEDRKKFVVENHMYDEYKEWFEKQVTAITAKMRERLHAINPNLIIGTMPGLEWIAGISNGLGTEEMPLVVFLEDTYLGTMGRLALNQALAEVKDLPVVFATGLWPNKDSAIKVGDFATKVKAGYTGDLGYWIYSGNEIEKEPKYYDELEKANNAILNIK